MSANKYEVDWLALAYSRTRLFNKPKMIIEGLPGRGDDMANKHGGWESYPLEKTGPFLDEVDWQLNLDDGADDLCECSVQHDEEEQASNCCSSCGQPITN